MHCAVTTMPYTVSCKLDRALLLSSQCPPDSSAKSVCSFKSPAVAKASTSNAEVINKDC